MSRDSTKMWVTLIFNFNINFSRDNRFLVHNGRVLIKNGVSPFQSIKVPRSYYFRTTVKIKVNFCVFSSLRVAFFPRSREEVHSSVSRFCTRARHPVDRCLDRFFRKRVNSQLDIRGISRLINADLAARSDLCGLPAPPANNRSERVLPSFSLLRLNARGERKASLCSGVTSNDMLPR